MFKRTCFLLFFLTSFLSVLGQSEIKSLKNMYLLKSVSVEKPVFLSQVNIKGESFGNKELLESFVSIPQDGSIYEEKLRADVFDYFTLPKAQGTAKISLLYFQISVDRFCRTNVKIQAPSMYELYINGDKKPSKTTVEDSIAKAKIGNISIETSPGNYEFVIKYISFPENISPEKMKITVSAEDNKDVQYVFMDNQSSRKIKINDIIEGKKITDVSISPNGEFTLLSYNTIERGGKSRNEKELISLKNNKKIVLPGNIDFSWMPVSNKLFYRENNSLVTLDPVDMRTHILSESIPDGNFYFSPDESFLIYTNIENQSIKGDLIRLESPQDRQASYRSRYYLTKFNLKSGINQRLTFGTNSTFLEDLSKDSKYLLFSIRNEKSEEPFIFSSMFRLHLETMQVDTIWQNEGYAGSAKFSPDGKKIIITGASNAFGNINSNPVNTYNQQAYIMDMESKYIKKITSNFDPSISNMYWNAPDNMIYFKVVETENEKIYRYNPDKEQFTLLPLNENVIKNISFSNNSLSACYFGLSVSNSMKAYSLDLKNNKSSLIAYPNERRFSRIVLGETGSWTFESKDGTVIDGRYYLPPNFSDANKYPLIVYYYGGALPTTASLEGPYPPHVYAALGYIVYVIQPSGAIGYGECFSARHVNAWGKYAADDIITGTKKFIADHPFVNPDRVGCIGASFGGFMTMYLQTQTDLFKTAVSHAGISSISSYWGTGYWGYTYSTAASAGSYPWNNREMYVGQSPLFNADKINTPLLLLHGTEDTNVPIGESIQMYTALKVLGKPVEFIQVKGENHGVRNYQRKLEWNNTIFAWFAKWLQDDPLWWQTMYQN